MGRGGRQRGGGVHGAVAAESGATDLAAGLSHLSLPRVVAREFGRELCPRTFHGAVAAEGVATDLAAGLSHLTLPLRVAWELSSELRNNATDCANASTATPEECAVENFANGA